MKCLRNTLYTFRNLASLDRIKPLSTGRRAQLLPRSKRCAMCIFRMTDCLVSGRRDPAYPAGTVPIGYSSQYDPRVIGEILTQPHLKRTPGQLASFLSWIRLQLRKTLT